MLLRTAAQDIHAHQYAVACAGFGDSFAAVVREFEAVEHDCSEA